MSTSMVDTISPRFRRSEQRQRTDTPERKLLLFVKRLCAAFRGGVCVSTARGSTLEARGTAVVRRGYNSTSTSSSATPISCATGVQMSKRSASVSIMTIWSETLAAEQPLPDSELLGYLHAFETGSTAQAGIGKRTKPRRARQCHLSQSNRKHSSIFRLCTVRGSVW